MKFKDCNQNIYLLGNKHHQPHRNKSQSISTQRIIILHFTYFSKNYYTKSRWVVFLQSTAMPCSVVCDKSLSSLGLAMHIGPSKSNASYFFSIENTCAYLVQGLAFIIMRSWWMQIILILRSEKPVDWMCDFKQDNRELLLRQLILIYLLSFKDVYLKNDWRPAWMISCTTKCRERILAGGLDWMISRDPLQLLWFYKYHQVQILAWHRTSQISDHMTELSKHFLNSSKLLRNLFQCPISL